MKKILSFALAVIMLVAIMMPAYAINEAEDVAQLTDALELNFGQIEELVFDYLEESNPAVLENSAVYIEFLMNQLLEDADKELATWENYSDVIVYMSEHVNRFQYLTAEVAELELHALPESAMSMTPAQRRAIVEAQDAALAQQAAINQSKINTRATSSYSNSAAVTYARTWANSRNSTYNSYANDCTNFVSQCLVAGGLAMSAPSVSRQAGRTGLFNLLLV